MASGHCLSHCLAHTLPGPLRRWSLAFAGRRPSARVFLGATANGSRALVQRRGVVSCSASHVSKPSASVGVAVLQGVSRNVVEVLEERGLIESVTNGELRAACMRQRLKVYCGFDPTAESLHLGNLLGIIVLSWFQRCVRFSLTGFHFGVRNCISFRRCAITKSGSRIPVSELCSYLSIPCLTLLRAVLSVKRLC